MRSVHVSARGVELIAEVLADLDPAWPPIEYQGRPLLPIQIVMETYGDRARAIVVVLEENPGEIEDPNV